VNNGETAVVVPVVIVADVVVAVDVVVSDEVVVSDDFVGDVVADDKNVKFVDIVTISYVGDSVLIVVFNDEEFLDNVFEVVTNTC